MGKTLFILYGLIVVGSTTWYTYSTALEEGRSWSGRSSSYRSGGGSGWSYGGSHK